MLNAADYGVAQDRERLICIGIKGMTDDTVQRIFPRKIEPRPGIADVCPDVVGVEGYLVPAEERDQVRSRSRSPTLRAPTWARRIAGTTWCSRPRRETCGDAMPPA